MSGNYDLCQSAREVAEVIGRDKALDLIEKYLKYRPGRGYEACFYVPKALKQGHPLIEHLGLMDAEKMVSEFAGMSLYFSSSRTRFLRARNDDIRRMAANDVSTREIAEIFGLTDRRIRDLTSDIRQGAMQSANDNPEQD